ncbi:MAG: Flp pilus assembly protein CpaB [Deltaproteobacteria bacterium]|nr:Flp pilus assembly protein CpaB [Deltaproteobacteria bacterium]
MKLNLPRGTIFLAAAVVAGLVATFGIHRYVSMKTRVVKAPSRQVFIANADISPGTALSGAAVKAVTWPQAVIPPNCVSSMRELENRVVKVPISQGNPVLFSMLAPVGTAAGLSGILEDGKRALTVKVDEVTGVAGFIHPGDHVDVLMDLPLKGQKDHFSKTILHDITILTTGQIWEQKGDNKPMVVNTVTLELTPEAAEVLNLASNNGKIRLALRNRNNKTVAQTSGVTTSILINGANAKKESKVAEPVREAKRVEVIKGLDRSEAKL